MSKGKKPSVESRYVAARIRRARTLRGWSAQYLAGVISEQGYPMHRASIAALETGDRLVTVDDLVAFAAAFDVNPSRLLGEQSLCGTCNDNPPSGFVCLNCGAEGKGGDA
jgi:transcriptional regulator with XRE-family HTH domain